MKRPNNPNLTIKVKPETEEEIRMYNTGKCLHPGFENVNIKSPSIDADLKCDFIHGNTEKDQDADEKGYHSAYRVKRPDNTKNLSENKDIVESVEDKNSVESMKEEEYEKSMEDIYGIKRKRSEESMEVIKSEESSITKKQKLEESREVEESKEIEKSIEVEESEESTEAGINPRRCINCGAICCADCFRETSPEDSDEEDRGSVEDNVFILDVLAGNYTPTPPKDVTMEDISSENKNPDDSNSSDSNKDSSNNKPDSSNNSESGSGSGSGSNNNPNSVSNDSNTNNNSESDNNSGTDNSNNSSSSTNTGNGGNNNQSNYYSNEDSNENSNKRSIFIEYSFILFFQIASALSDCIDIFF